MIVQPGMHVQMCLFMSGQSRAHVWLQIRHGQPAYHRCLAISETICRVALNI